MKIKVTLLLSLCLAVCSVSFSQVRLEPFFSYGKYTLGLGVGNTHMYGDLEKSISEPAFRLNFERNINSFSGVGIEAEYGALSSEEFKNHWTSGLNMYNQYKAVDINGRVAIGQFFDYPKNHFYKALYRLYLRSGFGVISNNLTNITYKFRNKDKLDIKDVSYRAILTNETAVYIPVSVGFNINLTERCLFNINYKFVYAFSDYVDGYNFPTGNAHNYFNDMYSVLSVGLSFQLGNAGLGDER